MFTKLSSFLVSTYNGGLRQLVVLLQAFLTGRSAKATVAETPYRIQASNSSPEDDNGGVEIDDGDDDLDDDDGEVANDDGHQHWGSAHSGGQTATGAGATAGREPRLENGRTAVLKLRQKIKTVSTPQRSGRGGTMVGWWINRRNQDDFHPLLVALGEGGNQDWKIEASILKLRQKIKTVSTPSAAGHSMLPDLMLLHLELDLTACCLGNIRNL